MKTVLVVIGSLIALAAVVGILWWVAGIGYNNSEHALRNKAEAQRGEIENVYDKMWKVLQQKAQVTDEYKNAFKEIYPALIEGRYSQGDGSLMKWITESNPSFDVSLYKDLMRSIEVERNFFAQAQKLMLDIVREHKTYCENAPARWFIDNPTPIEYTVISSTRAKSVMDNGIDDDIKLF